MCLTKTQNSLSFGQRILAHYCLVLDIAGVNGENDLSLILEGLQKTQFHVRIVAWKATGRMKVVHQLAAKLQIQLAELPSPAANLVTLFAQVLIVVKSQLHRSFVL